MNLRLMAFIVFAVLSSLGQSLRRAPTRSVAQRPNAREIAQVMHCLTAVDLNWLGDSPTVLENAKRFHVGLTHDRRTYPGTDMMFVAVFRTATEGDVFELTHQAQTTAEKYNLENNGSFRVRGKEFTWPNEIFGGIWTHEYVERNIRSIMRGPKFWVQSKVVVTPAGVACTYYGSE